MADLLGDTGCPECRYFWVASPRPPYLAVSHTLHAFIYRCTTCRTYWEEFDRYAIPVTPEQVRADFPELGDVAGH